MQTPPPDHPDTIPAPPPDSVPPERLDQYRKLVALDHLAGGLLTPDPDDELERAVDAALPAALAADRDSCPPTRRTGER